MRKFVRGVVALGALVACTAPGRAETGTIATLGYWKAFGGTSDDGTPVCGIQTSFGRNASGGAFLIKWFSGQSFLTIQIVKPGWNIPSGIQAPVALILDGKPWNVLAKRGIEPQFLEFFVPQPKVRDFTHDFTAASLMVVRFGSGSEPPWNTSLIGNSAIMSTMMKCIDGHNPADAQNPYAYVRSAQPYATPVPTPGPSSTQPFAGVQSPPAPASPPSRQPTTSVKDGGSKGFVPSKEPGD